MKLFHEIETHNCKTPNKAAVTMSLYQLQELASRQQEQIESTHRLIMNKEQRLNYLSSVQDSQHGPIFDYDQNFSHLKEKIALQETKLRKLRLLKGQAKKQLCSSSNICSELETAKIIFKEKERELSVAMTKIEALTRQLDEIKKGIILNSYNMNGTFKHTTELEKLRQELLYKTKMCKQNEEELIIKRNMLFKRQAEIVKIDQKINELQSRLTRKRQLNQQLSSQMHSIRTTNNHSSINNDALFAPKTYLRSSIGHSGQMNKLPYDRNAIPSNVATVEPLPRYKGSILKYEFVPQLDFSANKQDSKYQTLPYNTKFGARNGHMNYSNAQKEDSNLNGYFQNMSSNNCDNVTDNVSGNNISLIINHKNDSKDTSLEERPSPSGSSGSSDRISSSLTTYSYNDKMSLNHLAPNNQNFYNNLENNYLREQSANESDLYSHQYVPNSSLPDNRNEPNKSTSCSVLDNYYKTKPSAPIKPVSNEPSNDVVDNSCLKSSFLLNQRNIYDNYCDKEKLYSIENYEKSHQLHASLMSCLNRPQLNNQEVKTSESAVPPDNANNSEHPRDSKFSSIDNYDDKENQDKNGDNMKNYKIEQRSSVSEIITKLNNWNIPKNPFDWEKAKRRPVLITNEMEQELSDTATSVGEANKSKNVSSNSEPTVKENSSDDNNNKLDQDLANNNRRTTKNEDNFSNETNNEANKKGETKILSPLKRLKGSLKTQECTKTKIPLRRRVSFDPLALLLDASLEGELELVKKTSTEVPNPSASNDEGITALHNATCAAHFDIVKYLVEIGCDVNVQDSDGWTPLHCAASCNNLVMIKFLVKSGACIFATTFSDHETAAEKCEEDEEGFDGCSQYLYGIQDNLGYLNNGTVYAVYDYESQNNDELSFKDGDAIHILRKGDDQEKEWWWSRIADKEGYIPRNLIGLYPRIKPSYK